MLELDQVDLADLAEALEDHAYDHEWWLDPTTGQVHFLSDGTPADVDPDAHGWLSLDALPSRDSYQDMVDFTERVTDHRVRERLLRALEGRGAFRRFKDALYDLHELRQSWFTFHDNRMAGRAIRWLADNELVDREAAELACKERPDQLLPGLGNPVDVDDLAADVARDLRELYGDRLVDVILFGSWARGDAHPESDIDLLVVLDRVESTWDELDRSDELLGRWTRESGYVVTSVPMSAEAVQRCETPLLVRVRAEGRSVL
jgi:predicted nucleotidyltransferase